MRSDLTWFEADTPSYKMDRNLSPIAFIDLFGAIIRQVRPSLTYVIHSGLETQNDVPLVSVELRTRVPYEVKQPRPYKQSSDGRAFWYQHRFTNIFRFRVYADSMVGALQEATYFEKLVKDYRAVIRALGVDDIFLVSTYSPSLDTEGRKGELEFMALDYQVSLTELKAELDIPIEVIQFRESFEYLLENEEVYHQYSDVDKLKFDPMYIVSVEQNGYFFVEGIDYIPTKEGIVWLTERVPSPFRVNYYRHHFERGFSIQNENSDVEPGASV